MNKCIATIMLMACVLAGYSYSPTVDSVSLAPDMEYVLKDVAVTLDQLIEVEGYSSEEELTA